MTTEFISSGTSNTLVVSSGTTLDVLAGGSAISSTILSGGIEHVSGVDSGALVSGGTQYVSTGGFASGAFVYDGGSQVVLAGGSASATVLSGGAQYVSSGGEVVGTLVSAGGEYVSSSGFASATTVYSGGAQYVLSGGTAAATVLSGGTQYVASGGTTTGTAVGVAAIFESGVLLDPFLTSGASFGSEVVSAGGTAGLTEVYVSGALYVAGSALSAALSGGFATISAGGVAIATTIDAGEANVLTSASNVYSAVTAAGTLTVLAGGTASNTEIVSGALVDAGGAVTGSVTLGGSAAELVISTTALPAATVSGFATGVTIDFAGIAPASSGAITLDAANHRIEVVEGGTTHDLLLDPTQNFSGDTLSYIPDGGAGTDVTLACFAEGTRIATPDGEVAVEALQPGQLVLTLGGAAAPVLWLAVQSVARRFADPMRVLPIRIRAGALADGVPRRDLLLSPGHALLLDGLLVQAGALVNGVSITPVERMPEAWRYYHVRLPDHAVILAEGAAAESFLDGLEGFAFDNTAPAASGGGPALSYPRVTARRQLPETIRARLAARAALLRPPAAEAAA